MHTVALHWVERLSGNIIESVNDVDPWGILISVGQVERAYKTVLAH